MYRYVPVRPVREEQISRAVTAGVKKKFGIFIAPFQDELLDKFALNFEISDRQVIAHDEFSHIYNYIYIYIHTLCLSDTDISFKI